MRFVHLCVLYSVCSLCLISVSAARFKTDRYKYRNYHYRKYATNKMNVLLGNILDGHPTEKDVIQKAKSLEKFLFYMPDPSVNGGYRQMLREQRKHGEEVDLQMKKSRNEMRERVFLKMYEKNAKIGDAEGKLLKQILESRGSGKPNRRNRLGCEQVLGV